MEDEEVNKTETDTNLKAEDDFVLPKTKSRKRKHQDGDQPDSRSMDTSENKIKRPHFPPITAEKLLVRILSLLMKHPKFIYR